jgi:hypothetical protein
LSTRRHTGNASFSNRRGSCLAAYESSYQRRRWRRLVCGTSAQQLLPDPGGCVPLHGRRYVTVEVGEESRICVTKPGSHGPVTITGTWTKSAVA